MGGTGKVAVSPVVAGAILGVIVLVIVVAGLIYFRHAAPGSRGAAGQMRVPAAVQQQDQQFLTGLENVPSAQRQEYLNGDPERMAEWDKFQMTATSSQKAEFARDMIGH